LRIGGDLLTQRSLIFIVCLFVSVLGIGQSPKVDSEKGKSILKMMSDKLAKAGSFSFSTAEFHDRLKPNGQRAQFNVTRDVVVRRPDGFWTIYRGDRDFEFWYDGKLLTGISGEKKIYVQREMPSTLDQALDMLAQRLNLDLPMSDVLYSSPYDAFMDDQTSGGLVGKESIDSESCSHLAYVSPPIDWQLWVSDKTSLPCKLEMKYKKEKGISSYKIAFSKWNLKPEIQANKFAFKIPQGYVRIPILERVTIQQPTETAPSENN
jgi:hypothetical protein